MNIDEQIKKIKEISQAFDNLEKQLKEANEVVSFYSNPKNWSRREQIQWNSIDHDDCADYPHFKTKRAREYLDKYNL